MRVMMMGSGGVGGFVGAGLFDTGHDVTFVARGAHLEAIRERRAVHAQRRRIAPLPPG